MKWHVNLDTLDDAAHMEPNLSGPAPQEVWRHELTQFYLKLAQ